MTSSLHACLRPSRRYNPLKTAGSAHIEKSPSAAQADLPAAYQRERWRTQRRLLLCTLTLLVHGTALAGSIQFPADATALDDLDFSNTTQSRDRPPGSIERTTNSARIEARDIDCPVTKTVTVNGTPVPGNPTIFKTNIEGLGIRFHASKDWQGAVTLAPFSETLGPISSLTGTYLLRAEEVVYGVLGSGTVTSLPSMNITFSGSCVPTISRNQFIRPGTRITLRSCNVTTPTVLVPMAPIRLSDLPAVGSTAGTTSFGLDLNCSRSIAVYVTLTDVSNPANRSTTLGLAAGSSASGIGLQILNDQTLIAYGPDSPLAGTPNQWMTGGYSLAGATKIPLKVRYVRTGSSMSSGSVLSRATFTMSYQ
jgi:type 1 fimbria pilin